MAYQIEYSPEAEEHLRVLSAPQRATVFDGIEEQPTKRIIVLAVGVKRGNRVLIGGQEIDL